MTAREARYSREMARRDRDDGIRAARANKKARRAFEKALYGIPANNNKKAGV